MPRRIRLDPTVLHPEARALKEFLEIYLIGQRRAIDVVVKAYNYFLSPLWRPEKPIICLLSLGPSGSGKTLLAELLALYFFGDRAAMTKIRCAEYAERHEIAKLIGSPPGYVNHGQPTIFSQERLDRFAWQAFFSSLEDTDEEYKRLSMEVREAFRALQVVRGKPNEEKASFIRDHFEKRKRLEAYRQSNVGQELKLRKPRSVVLFDEVERANRSLHNILLEVSDKAKTTLGNGDETDFSLSIIIETSNVGSEQMANIAKRRGVAGFGTSQRKIGKTDREIYDAVMKEAKKVFNAEYLGRHAKVVYRLLTSEQLAQVLEIATKEMLSKLWKEGFALEVVIAPEVKSFILGESLDHAEYGARLLGDKVRKYLAEPIAALMNSGQIDSAADKLYVDLEIQEDEIFTVFHVDDGSNGNIKTPPATEGGSDLNGVQKPRLRKRQIERT